MTTNDTATIWSDFAQPLRRFIRRRVGDDAIADDLLGEAFLRIHRGLGTLDAPDRLGAWLYRIARNVIADHYRSRRMATVEAEDRPGAGTDEADESKQLARCVRPMIERLPEPYREALLLSEMEGIPQSSVAERLGISTSGAKSRVQRGREQLKAMILQCCHVDLDRRGNVLEYRERGDCGCREERHEGT